MRWLGQVDNFHQVAKSFPLAFARVRSSCNIPVDCLSGRQKVDPYRWAGGGGELTNRARSKLRELANRARSLSRERPNARPVALTASVAAGQCITNYARETLPT